VKANRLLRWLASVLVRGPHAADVLADLDQAIERDLERGRSVQRARWRYFTNALTSALTLGSERLRRAARRLPRFGFSLIDVKLAVRMLVKHPGLTLVAVFALALGIPTALFPFQMINIFSTPLPFEDGSRIVGLRHRVVGEFEALRGSLHEYQTWRESLGSFDQLGAASSSMFNIIADDGRAEPWRGAHMSASAFGIVRVSPVLGRSLVAADELPGAPDVVVISHRLWQSVLGGDPAALGKQIRVRDARHTVVGVMPEGFLFPVNDDLWLPLRAEAAETQPGNGPSLWIFGRLSEGVSEKRALDEMTAVENGLDETFPDVYASLRPEIVPFTFLITNELEGTMWVFLPFQIIAVALLAVACGNVGTLVLARTAARSGEVAVRTALGASRARIVSQLFVESLVLAMLATGIGLALAELVADQFARGAASTWSGEMSLPFWLDFGPNRRTVAQALALAAFSAVIAGVLPALKATKRDIQGNLQRASVSRSGIRFGRATTALIVVEVALGVGCLFASTTGWRLVPRVYAPASEIASHEYLSARLRVGDRPLGALSPAQQEATLGRMAFVQGELLRRLAAEPGVRGVALAGTLPGEPHEAVGVEVEGAPGTAGLRWVKRATVAVGFFDGLGVPILNGRDFAISDVPARDQPSTAVIVNSAFVERVLHGGNPIGRLVRYRRDEPLEPGPWLEIVGVVPDLGMLDADGMADYAGLYYPALPGALDPVKLAIHLGAEPTGFAPRLRAIAAEIDPAAILEKPVPLSEIMSADRHLIGWLVFGVSVIAGVAVLLSIASLYALMSFTVAQRTHEIGIRTTLGAEAGDIMAVIARRALLQLATGILIAVTTCVTLLVWATGEGLRLEDWNVNLAASAGAVLLIGLLACIAPARRGLRIRPMDAMRV
jgi:putative ABC transport system permease protein